MPIYEYACRTCEHKFELFQRIGAPPPDTCPECGAADVRKLISMTSFVLKGSGWYRDHYGLQPSAAKDTASAPAPTAPPATSGAKDTSGAATQAPNTPPGGAASPSTSSPSQPTAMAAK